MGTVYELQVTAYGAPGQVTRHRFLVKLTSEAGSPLEAGPGVGVGLVPAILPKSEQSVWNARPFLDSPTLFIRSRDCHSPIILFSAEHLSKSILPCLCKREKGFIHAFPFVVDVKMAPNS